MAELSNNKQNENSPTPLVSICCLAYNQEKYIRQAIEGLLMQRTSFPYEIIIHDDASTDSTQEIIEEYFLEFPHIIRPIFQKKNKYSTLGMSFLFKYVSSEAKGKYIALCAGDDFWIDPLKIQKQVNLLESNSEFGLVHTKAIRFVQEEQKFKGSRGFKVDNLEELLTENTIAAFTVCMRRKLLMEYFEKVRPESHTNWTVEDYPTWIWFMLNSKIKFINEYTGVYRWSMGSLSHIKDDYKVVKFGEGVYSVIDYFLSEVSSLKSNNKIRARYYSNIIKYYFLTKKWNRIQNAVKIFYNANDWLNIIWILITLPFSFSRLMIRASYRIRNIVFDFFDIYPIRE